MSKDYSCPAEDPGDTDLISWLGRSLKEVMATQSNNLAWRISWTEESGKLYSPWVCKESDMTEVTLHAHAFQER